MRKRRTKANAERYTALSLKHRSCGTILPVRQRRLCCLLCFPPAGYSWDQAERRGEGVANCSLSGSLQPPSLHQTKVCTATESERPGGGGGFDSPNFVPSLRANNLGETGFWNLANTKPNVLLLLCALSHLLVLISPFIRFPKHAPPGHKHTHTHTCAQTREQRT